MSWAFCRMRVDTPTTHSPSVPSFARPSRLPPRRRCSVSGVRAVRTTHGQRLPTLGQWEPGERLLAERSTLR